MIEWIFGAATVISLGIAIWQYFESRYYQKINEYNDDRIKQLMTDNQSLLHKIDKGTEQTFKQKDMTKLLPKIFEMKTNSEPRGHIKKIAGDLSELRKDVERVKSEFKSGSKAKKEIENIDSKIKQTERDFREVDDGSDRIDFALTFIENVNELKDYINIFSWLAEKPRKYEIEISERSNILGKDPQEIVSYKILDIPKTDTYIPIGIFAAHLKEFFNEKNKTIILSPLGEKLLRKMKIIFAEKNK